MSFVGPRRFQWNLCHISAKCQSSLSLIFSKLVAICFKADLYCVTLPDPYNWLRDSHQLFNLMPLSIPRLLSLFGKLLPLNKGLKQTKEKSDFYLQPMLVSEKNALLNSTIKSKFALNTAQYIVVNSAAKCCFIQYEVILFAFSSL